MKEARQSSRSSYTVRRVSMLVMMFAMLALAACTGRQTAEIKPEEYTAASEEASSEPASDAESMAVEITPETSSERDESSPQEIVEPPENTAPVDLSLPMNSKTGEPTDEVINFSICLPTGWTLSDTGTVTEIFDEDGNLIAEAEGRDITLEDADSFFADAVVIRDITAREIKGKYYHMQSEVVDGGMTVLQNDLIYCLDVGDRMIEITFYPYFGTGIGTQNERFASYIDTVEIAQ